jgi:hypothetical protein
MSERPTRRSSSATLATTEEPEITPPTLVEGVTPDPLGDFHVTTVKSTPEGTIEGVTPSTKFYLVPCAPEGCKTSVRVPPSANLAPPKVRRSLLIVVEGDDPVRNPPR